jgi:DNA-binding response OmpR family regulator
VDTTLCNSQCRRKVPLVEPMAEEIEAVISSPRGRVLVIEDEFLIAAMVEDLLADFECDCVGPIANLEEGVAAARTEIVDVAIINLMIQGKPAYAVTEALAERNIPFCFASGVRPTDLPERWRDRPFLTKPYVIADVRAFLVTVLPSLPGEKPAA